MQKYSEMSREQLLALKKELDQQYADIKAQGLALDMSRGKPAADQLDLSMELMDVLSSSTDLRCETGVDCRNYGVMDGIPEAKKLIADVIGTKPENVIIYGNSSLNIMYDQVARAEMFGICGNTPWCKLDKVKFLCPVPGYDRHFKLTESFGFEQFSGFEGLFDAFVREIDVRPSREAVFAVPRAFAVPQQYDFFHGMICFYLYFTSLRHSPRENAWMFSRVVRAMLSSASRVKNPWWEVRITLLKESRRASMSSSMIRSEVS